MKSPSLLVILPVMILVSGAAITASAEDAKANPAEAAFSAMLTNATLKGSWAPIAGGAQGDKKDDGYQIVSATKKELDVWTIISKFTVNGDVIEYPMAVVVKFAGDTAVLILDDAPTAGGGTYSARVMFHNDVYAGSWWGGDQEGTISGIISRDKE